MAEMGYGGWRGDGMGYVGDGGELPMIVWMFRRADVLIEI